MTETHLVTDPLNIIIAGVGGQGNVIASRLLGAILSDRGLYVTIGETFGAAQRGGSVMSHLRVSAQGTLSPQIPRGQAHLVVALEPVEVFRVLHRYGNPSVRVLINTRPIYPAGVNAGEADYPEPAALKAALEQLAARTWHLDATGQALAMGNAILGNSIMLGALSTQGGLPVDRESFGAVLARFFPENLHRENLRAFDLGVAQATPPPST